MQSIIIQTKNKIINKHKTASKLSVLLIIILIGIIDLKAQTTNSIKMKSYIPKSNAFDIYYPENYAVLDSEDIVSFHNLTSGLNVTVMHYMADKNIDEKYLIGLLSDFIKEYYNIKLNESDWSIYQTKFDNVIETRFENKGTQWVWWGISQKNKTVFISQTKIN